MLNRKQAVTISVVIALTFTAVIEFAMLIEGQTDAYNLGYSDGIDDCFNGVNKLLDKKIK